MHKRKLFRYITIAMFFIYMITLVIAGYLVRTSRDVEHHKVNQQSHE